MDSLRLKITSSESVRRVALKAPITFERLVELLGRTEESGRLDFVVKYLDDENELITISSDEDLEEAVNLMQETKAQVLKIQLVFPSASSSSKSAVKEDSPITIPSKVDSKDVPVKDSSTKDAEKVFGVAASKAEPVATEKKPALDRDDGKSIEIKEGEEEWIDPYAKDAEKRAKKSKKRLVEAFTQGASQILVSELPEMVKFITSELKAKTSFPVILGNVQKRFPKIDNIEIFKSKANFDAFLDDVEEVLQLKDEIEGGELVNLGAYLETFAALGVPVPRPFKWKLFLEEIKKLLTVPGIPLRLEIIRDHCLDVLSKISIPEESIKIGEAAPAVHEGFGCNGCGMRPIVGKRYRCTICPDYDLCEKCEASAKHPEEHIMVMHKAPLAASFAHLTAGFPFKVSVVKGEAGSAAESSSKSEEKFSGWSHHHKHGYGKSGAPKKKHWEGRSKSPKCPWTAAPVAAPSCKAPVDPFASVPVPVASKAAPGASPFSAAPPAAISSYFSSKFIRDVSMDDGSVVSRGELLVKTWAVQNDGGVAWPEDVKLEFVSGNRELLFEGQTHFAVPAARANQVVDVSAVLKAPSIRGRYKVVFRLIDGRGKQFGHSFWADVVVV